MGPHTVTAASRPLAGDWFVRLCVPAYIAAGGVMKLLTGRPDQLPLVSLHPDPSPALERFAAAALPVVTGVELVVAGAILLGGRWARWVALAVLCVFAAVLVPHVSVSAASCGCFGAVRSSPTLMLITAIGGALLVVLLPATGRPLWSGSARLLPAWVLAVVLLVGVVHGGAIPERLGWRVRTLRLRPQEWTGLRLADLPFASALESETPGGLPSMGDPAEQTWVLWLRSCPHCHEYFRERWSQPTDRRVVAVEVPPSADGVPPEEHAIDCPSCLRLHLRAGTFYFLPRTPVVLTVRAGVVAAVDVNPGAPPTLDDP